MKERSLDAVEFQDCVEEKENKQARQQGRAAAAVERQEKTMPHALHPAASKTTLYHGISQPFNLGSVYYLKLPLTADFVSHSRLATVISAYPEGFLNHNHHHVGSFSIQEKEDHIHTRSPKPTHMNTHMNTHLQIGYNGLKKAPTAPIPCSPEPSNNYSRTCPHNGTCTCDINNIM